MKGYLLLEGGAEFGGRMAEPDRRAIELAGGLLAPLRIIPTAAAPDNNHLRAGQNGLRWFRSLGAQDVQVIPLIDKISAGQPEITSLLEQARLIYLLGGFPGYLADTLAGTPAWQAINSAYQSGAVIAGSSAGAMVLCEHFFDPSAGKLRPGLGLLPRSIVLPHYNSSGEGWIARLGERPAGLTLYGIDERTGMINDARDGLWRVYGQGKVTVHHDGRQQVFSAGQVF
jgi:cyanophycinase